MKEKIELVFLFPPLSLPRLSLPHISYQSILIELPLQERASNDY